MVALLGRKLVHGAKIMKKCGIVCIKAVAQNEGCGLKSACLCLF